MIDVFEKFAPQYARILRKFALDVWYDRADPKELMQSAERFKKRYQADLVDMFRRRRLSFSMPRVKELADLWLWDQIGTGKKIFEIAAEKKKNLYEKYKIAEQEAREKVSELREAPRTEKGLAIVVPDTSFSGNLARRALQIGEDEAFDLGRDLNHFVVSSNSDVYKWMTQKDSVVRPTHRKLQGKLFSYNDPPTTIDKYGHTHTGNPGTDWGCRCWEDAAVGKPLFGFIVKA